MAKIDLIAFVSDWKFGEKEPNPKWGMKVSEPHSKKDGDNWVKVGATNYTVKAAYGTDIDFSKYSQGERVHIRGTLVSEDWESNGKKGKNLVIKATSADPIGRGENYSVGTREPELPSDWKLVDEDAPF